ncbi:hypothetical protein ScPMuIL_006643 [Solemya velum]
MENGGSVEMEVNSPDSGITVSGDSIQKHIKKDNVVDDLTSKFDSVLSSGDGILKQESESSADAKDNSTDDSEEDTDDEIELENQLQLNSNSFEECEKCEKPYNDPVLLSCLHSFCRQCVEDIIQSISTEEKPRAKCPSCGEVTRLTEGGVQKLKSNTFIERLVSGNAKSECVCDSHKLESDGKKAEVLELLKELKTKGKSMELGDIEARLRNLEEAEANEIEKIESAFTSVLASIMKDKEDALKNLNKQFEKQRNYCSMRKRNAENFYHAIHTTTLIANKILEDGHPEEILALEDKICERIGRLLARTFRPSINFTSPSVDVKLPEKIDTIYNVIPAKDLNPKSGRTKKKSPKNKKNEQQKKNRRNSSGSGANNYNNLKRQGVKSGRIPPPLMSLPLVGGPQSVMTRQIPGPGFGSQAMSPPLPLSHPNSGPVYLRLVQRIDTAVQNDLRRPDLMGITCTAEGAVAVADHNNNRIKMFTPSGQFCEAFPALQPSSLAACGNIIAWSNHSMVHYNAKGRGCIQKLSFPSQGSVRHPHPVASYLNRQVLVAGIQKRYIRTYGLDGKRIQQVEQRAPDGSWLQKVVCVTVNSNGAYIMSDWDLNAVVFANSNGEPYAQYPPPMERGLHRNWLPGGLCGDHRGNIFVADGQGDRILLLNHRGQLLQEWSTSLYLPQPWAITCNHSGQLFVTGHDGYINVFQFGYQM